MSDHRVSMEEIKIPIISKEIKINITSNFQTGLEEVVRFIAAAEADAKILNKTATTQKTCTKITPTIMKMNKVIIMVHPSGNPRRLL